jgi:general stress protein CsbA
MYLYYSTVMTENRQKFVTKVLNVCLVINSTLMTETSQKFVAKVFNVSLVITL